MTWDKLQGKLSAGEVNILAIEFAGVGKIIGEAVRGRLRLRKKEGREFIGK